MPAPTSFVDSSTHGNTGIATNIIDGSRILEFDLSIYGGDLDFPDLSTIYDDTVNNNDGITYDSKLAPIQLLPFFIKPNSFCVQFNKPNNSYGLTIDVATDIGFTSMVSSYYTAYNNYNSSFAIVGEDILTATNLYVRAKQLNSYGLYSFYSNIKQITKTAGTSYGTRCSFIDFFQSSDNIYATNNLSDDSANHYDAVVGNNLPITKDCAITFENDLVLPKAIYVPRAVLNGLTAYTFATRAKFNAISSARNVFFSNYNSTNQIIEFGINAGTFYIKLNSTVYNFTATTLPMNDGLERKILLTFNNTTGFTLYVDNMTTAFSTISMSLTRNWDNSDIYIGASISTTPLPIVNTSLNATVCNIAFYDHELTLSERNNYVAIPSRI